MLSRHFLYTIALLAAPLTLAAKIPVSTREAVIASYPPATSHKGLWNAAHPLELAKIRSYVVLLQGGIPAERAEWFITNIDFDYRPSVIDLRDNTIDTRRGRTRHFLQAGDIMLVSDVVTSGDTIYLKLLSIDDKASGKQHPSRLAAMVGFKFDKTTVADSAAVQNALAAWMKPFATERAAIDFARTPDTPPRTAKKKQQH